MGILSDWVKKGFNFGRVQKRRLYGNDLINKNEKESPSVVWIKMKNENHFSIKFIFVIIYEFYYFFYTIYRPHCIILTNFYLYLSFIYSTFCNKFLISVK